MQPGRTASMFPCSLTPALRLQQPSYTSPFPSQRPSVTLCFICNLILCLLNFPHFAFMCSLLPLRWASLCILSLNSPQGSFPVLYIFPLFMLTLAQGHSRFFLPQAFVCAPISTINRMRLRFLLLSPRFLSAQHQTNSPVILLFALLGFVSTP